MLIFIQDQDQLAQTVHNVQQYGSGAKMSLLEQIIEAFPELADNMKVFADGVIVLQDDSDGAGAYIAQWNYEKPLPAEWKLGK